MYPRKLSSYTNKAITRRSMTYQKTNGSKSLLNFFFRPPPPYVLKNTPDKKKRHSKRTQEVITNRIDSWIRTIEVLIY